MANRSTPRLVQSVACGEFVFAFEEFWTEDSDGFCSTDFLWEKHTQLKVFERNAWKKTGRTEESTAEMFDSGAASETPDNGLTVVKCFAFDSGQREKELLTDGETVQVTYWPSYQSRSWIRISAKTLQILEEKTEHGL